MNMRKIIAVLSAVLMLCAIIPMSVFAAPGDVVVNKNFDDGSVFTNGSAEGGYMVFDATTADWANVYIYANNIKSGKLYEITFDAKANKATNMNVKINNNWGGDTFKWTTNITTEWATYTTIINPDELKTLTATALLMFTSNTTAPAGAIYHIDNVVVKEYAEPVAPGTNLVVNGDFETGNTNGWNKHQQTTVTADAAKSGSYGAYLNGNSASWGGVLDQNVNVESGKTYTFSFDYKAVRQGFNFTVAGVQSGTSYAGGYISTASWTHFEKEFTVAGDTQLLINYNCGGQTGTDEMYVDNISLKEEIAPSFDGYIYNGDLETGKTDPWNALWGSTALEIVEGKDGGSALKGTSSGAWNITYQEVAVTPNTNYTVWAYVKDANQSALWIKNAGGNGDITSKNFASGSDWSLTSVTFNSGSNNTVWIGLMGLAAGGTYTVDDVFMFEAKEQSNDGYIKNGTFETGAISPWENLWGSCPTAEIMKGGKDDTFALNLVSGQWKHFRQTGIAVKANTDYKISLWSKNVKNMNLLVKDNADTTNIVNKGIANTNDWALTEFTFNTGANTSILISLMGGAEEAYGQFDNIVMEELHTCAYTNEEITLEPTCTEPGSKKLSCSCGEFITEEIPAYHNGNMEYNAAKDAIDCANPGNIENYYCPGCGEYFADAYAQEIINPWYIEITVDCVAPEGLADCAAWTCETCGTENFGAGEHDVVACQGGTCSKCNAEIEGYGCANYDTPACEDGVCYYCGGFVAGFGHENGAWAPCEAGECTYGCGLVYPATEDHVDSDADDYCDNCWTHLNHVFDSFDPCYGGECSVCWTYVEGAHAYDDGFDTDCNVCGDVRTVETPVADKLMAYMEDDKDVGGLAVKFDINVDGLGIKAGKFTQADYTNSTWNGYELTGMGAVVSNGVSTKTVPAVYLYELAGVNDSEVTSYVVRVVNIEEANYNAEITFQPYFTVLVDGVETTIYGEIQSGCYSDYFVG